MKGGGRGLAVAGVFAAVTLVACGGDARGGRRLPDGSRLVQKKDYQALYGPDGRLQRLLNDRDRDGVAEIIVFYGPDGKPQRAELDTDGDERIDRWENFDDDGDGAVDGAVGPPNGAPLPVRNP